jgi:hypothetical protein
MPKIERRDKMAQDLKGTLNEIATEIKQFVANAATMTVETWYVPVGMPKADVPIDAQGHADFRQAAKPLAQTIVKFDGDSISVVPLVEEQDQLPQKDEDLLALHQRNVDEARKYRADIVNTFVDLLKELAPKESK